MKIAVVALVEHEGKILLGKKRRDSEGYFAGKWHIPGETMEDGETDEEALIRGMREEAGIEIRVGRYLAQHISPKGTLVRWYECIPQTYDISNGSDLEAIAWTPKKEVPSICKTSHLWPDEIKRYFRM